MERLDKLLHERLKAESDELLFNDLEFDDKLKERVMNSMKPFDIREKNVPVAQGLTQSRTHLPAWRSKWALGAAAAVVLLVVAVSMPLLNGSKSQDHLIEDPGLSAGVNHPGGAGTTEPDNGTVPGNGAAGVNPGDGAAGSGLTQLTTVTVQTPEEASARFGSALLVPSSMPEGFALDYIETTGMDPNAATRAVFFYQSGDQTIVYTVDRDQAVIPYDLFETIEVNGSEGYVYAQPQLTELYWIADGIQYAIVGPLTQEEALAAAASLE